jgi:hypothetical protein
MAGLIREVSVMAWAQANQPALLLQQDTQEPTSCCAKPSLFDCEILGGPGVGAERLVLVKLGVGTVYQRQRNV